MHLKAAIHRRSDQGLTLVAIERHDIVGDLNSVKTQPLGFQKEGARALQPPGRVDIF